MRKHLISLLLLLVSAAALGAKKLPISYGPWVYNVSDTSFTVLWTSPADDMVYLELAPDDGSAFEACSRPRYFEAKAGRRLVGRRHSIVVSGLKPGTAYRYRLCGQAVADASNPYYISYGPLYQSGTVWKVTTFDSAKSTCRFAMVNDIHFKEQRYKALTADVKAPDYDFLLLNGDIVSTADKLDTMLKYTFGPIQDKCANIPVVFARGNHEGRGYDFAQIPWAYPTPTGEFYFTFREGPVAFVVLDAGEDKPDDAVEYSGYAVYDSYREQELRWLREAVKAKEFADAPVKICLMHIPAINLKDSWYAQKWVNANFLPVLNDAGVNLMLSGHHHKYIKADKGEYGNAFPIIANSNVERLDVKVTESGAISLKFYSESGALVRSLDYK